MYQAFINQRQRLLIWLIKAMYRLEGSARPERELPLVGQI